MKILILLLLIGLVTAKESCNSDNNGCSEVNKNYCTPLVRIRGGYKHCDCNPQVTTKVIINDLRYDFYCVPKVNLTAGLLDYDQDPFSYDITCNNTNLKTCCNSTSSLYFDYDNWVIFTYNGVTNYLINVYCVDVSNNPFIDIPATENCSLYSDRLDVDSNFPNTTFCGWDFLQGWVQYNNSCEYYTSSNFTWLSEWGYYGPCCYSLAEVRQLPQFNHSLSGPYTSYNISNCSCNPRYLPVSPFEDNWYNDYDYEFSITSLYQWALNNIIPTIFFEGNWGASLTCSDNESPVYSDCDSMTCKPLCSDGSIATVIGNYTVFNDDPFIDVDVTPFKPYSCECFETQKCQQSKCTGHDCKYHCYSDGFNLISLASEPCDCNMTKVYDGMCNLPYNTCDDFTSLEGYNTRCTAMQFEWVKGCEVKLCWGIETHMCNSTKIPINSACVGTETWVYLDTFGEIQIYSSRQYNFYPCPSNKPKHGRVCHENRQCKKNDKNCHKEHCVEEKCDRCRHMTNLPHDTYCSDETLNGECIPFLYSRCGSCEYSYPPKTCYIDQDSDAWSFQNGTSFERWGPEWFDSWPGESGSSTPATVSGNSAAGKKRPAHKYKTNLLKPSSNSNVVKVNSVGNSSGIPLGISTYANNASEVEVNPK